MKRNLISKRIGIGNHMPANRFTRIVFKNADEFEATVSNNSDKGRCIRNQYVSDEWLQAWIKCNVNKSMGKTNAFYVYNVDYDDVTKPMKKYFNDNEDILYEYANGVMYFDLDNIGSDIVETVKQCFIELCKDKNNKYFQWFETSWSGKGCHIRLNFDLILHNKIEWMYLYYYHLDVLLKQIKKHVDISDWYTKTIDWSCATIMRGFAIPYNENGVLLNESHDSTIDFYQTIDDLSYDANQCCQFWEPELLEKFKKSINVVRKTEKPFVKKHVIVNVSNENVVEQSGELFDYNWRLKCVTALMSIYDGDKEKVREACKYIYSYIKPYKNHTYEEMMNDELENKILRNGNMTLTPSNEVIEDLENFFGFEFDTTRKVNKLYFPEFYKNIID